ncbi:hypothetical protein Srot_2931 [Segniliparus rotundus DSM 44985]|uniref:Lipoprotein n=1 Tax=Segniliparus rotundus (strain ATCC BAA-972 / CDC 1076 / CIP 108378 / DSM 44985 / JCM 13578) TaxID=640132 RepID=D6ZDV3_SEGRD|nr:hypothetical protein [Segniliparus rotundus]ADG99360.1 hypothetical protein Srot_2931 [Segniliparus rotundus DSM 44985]
MNRRYRLAIPALLAVAAALASCQRGVEQPTPTSTALASSTASPVPSAASPPNLVTPDTANKPILRLKLGDSASFRKGGVTVTVTPGKAEKLDAPPKVGKIDGKDPYGNCGSWIALPVHIVVDAEARAEWDGWYEYVEAPDGLYDERTFGEGDEVQYAETADTAGTTEPDDVNGNIYKTGTQWIGKGKPLHWDFTGRNYLMACKAVPEESSNYVPTDQPLTGYVWQMDIGKNPSGNTPIAIWSL